MKARCWLVAAAVVLLLPAAAGAQGIAGRFTIAAQVGTQSEVSGDLMKSSVGFLLDRPVVIDSVRYRDVYEPDWRLQLLHRIRRRRTNGADRARDLLRGRGRGCRGREDGGHGDHGGTPLFAFFDVSKYEEVGFEIGLRYYLATQSRLKSYIAPVVGVRFVDEILVSFSALEQGVSIQNVPFSKEGAVPVFGLDIGFTFDLGDHFYLGIDTGIRYQTPPGEFDHLIGLGGMRRQRRALVGSGRGFDQVCVSRRRTLTQPRTTTTNDGPGNGSQSTDNLGGLLCRPAPLHMRNLDYSVLIDTL